MCSCQNLCKNIIKNYLHNTIHFKSIVYFQNCSLQLTLKITSFDNFQFTKLIEKYLLLFQYYKNECCSAYHTLIYSVYELLYSGLQLLRRSQYEKWKTLFRFEISQTVTGQHEKSAYNYLHGNFFKCITKRISKLHSTDRPFSQIFLSATLNEKLPHIFWQIFDPPSILQKYKT